jgi:hypothetical protein
VNKNTKPVMTTGQAIAIAILALEQEQLVPPLDRPVGWAGECKEAVEALRQAAPAIRSVEQAQANLDRARARALVVDNDRARELLDRARELVLKNKNLASEVTSNDKNSGCKNGSRFDPRRNRGDER